MTTDGRAPPRAHGPEADESTPPPRSMAGVSMSPVLARIERQLRELWVEPKEPGALPRSRACTMNLVVVAQSRALAEKYTPIIDDVTAAIPARAIVVTMEPDSPSAALDGEATAVCSVAAGAEGQVCSERISLVASGSSCLRVSSAVEALLVPEMQTTLVWLGRVYTDDPVFASLAETASRVVLDTEYTSFSSLVKLAAWARAEAGRPEVADLAWTRLSIWQELSARFFDAKDLHAHAHGVTRLSLRQASDRGAKLSGEGSLFLAWMATRLDWHVQRIGGAVRFRRPDGTQVALSLSSVARPEAVAPGALTHVGVVAEAGGIVARGSIDRQLASGSPDLTPDADVLSWKLDVPLPAAAEQAVRLRANKEAALLVRTLHRPVHDPALTESIAFAEQLAEDGLVCA